MVYSSLLLKTKMNTFRKIFWILVCIILSAGLIRHYIFTDASTNDWFFVQSEKEHREYYFELFNIESIRHPDIESEYPNWFQPDESQSIKDLQHWVNLIPFNEDKTRESYIVYPKHWMVSPISIPSNDDTKKIENWEMFNHYPYLDNWALHYRWNNPTQGNWNMVVAAHSSYLKDAPGRYKTIFQVLPISKKWDNIFVYLKNDSWTFDLYSYIITDSFRTEITDVSVLAQNRDHKYLTTYWCYIIWDNSERRVNQAILESITENIDLNTMKWVANSDSPTLDTSHDVAPALLANNEQDTITTSNKIVISALELVQITNKISPELLPKLQNLVLIIQQRLQEEPQLYDRVYTRLVTKIENLRSSWSDASVLPIYEFIYYYIQLL